MILCVPDYYEEFSCIADRCKNNCCIGWEIDIDEDTYAYYSSAQGAFGERLRAHMYLTEDKEHSFLLEANGRCPFLNSGNLCDICLKLGEEALSEVCTEYPRFSLMYGNTLQKCLSLSCEEVGRIIFTHTAPVRFHRYELPDWDETDWDETEWDEAEWDEAGCGKTEERYGAAETSTDRGEAVRISILEEFQKQAVALLQNRTKCIWTRMQEYMHLAEQMQEKMNSDSGHRNGKKNTGQRMVSQLGEPQFSYREFDGRFRIFEEMEPLDGEWEEVRRRIREHLTRESYDSVMDSFLESRAYREWDYEHLMVYFTFRYLMNACWQYDLLSYAGMAAAFTRTILEMDAVRYRMNDAHFNLNDRIDAARIFSKEVEHSQENVDFILKVLYQR